MKLSMFHTLGKLYFRLHEREHMAQKLLAPMIDVLHLITNTDTVMEQSGMDILSQP